MADLVELVLRAARARRARLYVPAVLAPVAETALLWFLGPKGSAALAPQLTAPPPFDLFHDLRWISVYHNSWPLLGLELAAAVAFRSLCAAWMLQGAWPDDGPPPLPRAALRAGLFYAAAALLLLPWVALLFGMALTHLSYLFFVALPPALAVALLIHRGAMAQASGRWWTWRPTWGSVGWTLGAFGWLTVAGAIVSVAPLGVALPVAGLAGLLNGRAVRALADGVGRSRERPPRRLRAAVVPVALASVFAVVIGGTSAGFALTREAPRDIPPGIRIPAHAAGRPVLLAPGFNSRWGEQPAVHLPRGFVAWRYSYAGMGPDETVRPYGPADTLQPIVRSARNMAAEVRALRRAYGRPVTLVAESEGAIVARTFLVRLYRPTSHDVDRLVILDIPVSRSEVYYPPPGSQGWGVASGWGLRALAAIVRNVGPLELSADSPFFRDIAECHQLMDQVVGDPPPAGVAEVTVQALADAVDGGPRSELPDSSRYVVVAAHGGLIADPKVQSLIYDTLDGLTVRQNGHDGFYVKLINAVSEPWHSPALVQALTTSRSC